MLRESNKSFPDIQIPAGKEEHVIVLPAKNKYYTFIQTQNEVKLNFNFSKHILITLFTCVFSPFRPLFSQVQCVLGFHKSECIVATFLHSFIAACLSK